MKFIKDNAGLLRSARMWGVLVFLLALAVTFGSYSGTFAQTGNDPCCVSLSFLAGVKDDFTGGNPEPTNPPPGIPPAGYQGSPTPADFDGTQINQYFGHRFVLPSGNCIDGATLEIRAKPIGAGSENDSITLQTGNTNWVAYFGSGNPGTPLQSTSWANPPVTSGVIFLPLDLHTLPTGISNTQAHDLISDLNQNRILDVIVQDDSSVDYLELKVKFCECANGGTGTGGCVPAPAGMIHWWTFDETSGTIAHDIAGARNGDTKPGAVNSAGSPVSVPGKVSTAFEFDGSSALVVVPDSQGTLSLTSSFTLDAWINVKASDKLGIRSIVDKRLDQGGKISGYAFFLLDGFLSFQLDDGLVVASGGCGPATSTTTSCTNYISSIPLGNVADGTWQHVAAVVDKAATPKKITLR